jgi:hypothetical protein
MQVTKMHRLTNAQVVALLASLLLSTSAFAAPTEQAAAQFDAGVRFFDAAEYPAAARAFLRADAVESNGEAVANAITSALKTTDYLLVVEAARRGLELGAQDPGLAAKARRALAQARVHLAELDLSCAPAPCTIELDGVAVEPGAHLVLPGTHSLAARTPDGERHGERSQSFEVGTRYRIGLRADPSDAPPLEAGPATTPAPEPAQQPPDTGPKQPSETKLSPVWFYVGAGVTAVLLGATVWSGIDALGARSDHGDTAPAGAVDAIRGKRVRTDLLLLGSAVAAGATAYVGLVLVDWRPRETSAQAAPQGAVLTLHGSF